MSTFLAMHNCLTGHFLRIFECITITESMEIEAKRREKKKLYGKSVHRGSNQFCLGRARSAVQSYALCIVHCALCSSECSAIMCSTVHIGKYYCTLYIPNQCGIFCRKRSSRSQTEILSEVQSLCNKTSQELRMLSNVTLNCQETKTVMNSGSQFSE